MKIMLLTEKGLISGEFWERNCHNNLSILVSLRLENICTIYAHTVGLFHNIELCKNA